MDEPKDCKFYDLPVVAHQPQPTCNYWCQQNGMTCERVRKTTGDITENCDSYVFNNMSCCCSHKSVPNGTSNAPSPCPCALKNKNQN